MSHTQPVDLPTQLVDAVTAALATVGANQSAAGAAPLLAVTPSGIIEDASMQNNPVKKAVFDNTFNKKSSKKVVVIRTCEVCNIELTGQCVIDAHYAGNKHAKKVKAQALLSNLMGTAHVVIPPLTKSVPFQCEVCKVTLNSSQQLDVHYAVHHSGAKHKAKVSNKEDTPSTGDGAAPAEGSSNFEDSVGATDPSSLPATELNLSCTLCGITVNSPQQLEQHISSKKHVDRMMGRKQPRAAPYARPVRGGLGSSAKSTSKGLSHFTSLSNSFKSGGYSNSFIKEQGGVIMPSNSSSNTRKQCTSEADGQKYDPKADFKPDQKHSVKAQNKSDFKPGGFTRSKGNFGSLAPYVNNNDSANYQQHYWDKGSLLSDYSNQAPVPEAVPGMGAGTGQEEGAGGGAEAGSGYGMSMAGYDGSYNQFGYGYGYGYEGNYNNYYGAQY